MPRPPAARSTRGAHNRRFAPVYKPLKELLGKRLPHVAHIKMNRGELLKPVWTGDDSVTGGFLYETPIHMFDMMRFQFGEIVALDARLSGANDFSVLVEFASGMHARFFKSGRRQLVFPLQARGSLRPLRDHRNGGDRSLRYRLGLDSETVTEDFRKSRSSRDSVLKKRTGFLSMRFWRAANLRLRRWMAAGRSNWFRHVTGAPRKISQLGCETKVDLAQSRWAVYTAFFVGAVMAFQEEIDPQAPQREAALFYGLFLRGHSAETLRRDIDVPRKLLDKMMKRHRNEMQMREKLSRVYHFRKQVLAIFDELVDRERTGKRMQERVN